MKEINIARAVITKRKEKGITQEELANYIGVSSASVSKWETEQSYPDILLLPQLAAYFNISLDELMGYEPQMTKRDIGKLYCKLYEDLSLKSIDDVLRDCRVAIKKYFSCFPLLLQMGELLINAGGLVDDSDKATALMAEAKELFIRVRKESDDAEIIKTALYMEATCAIPLNPNEVIELLGSSIQPSLPQEILLATAYRMTERNEEAEATLQVGIYQSIMSAVNTLSAYVTFGFDDAEKFDEIVNRTLAIVEAFNIKKLQPTAVISLYIAAATVYMQSQNTEKALGLLEQYAELATGDISWRLKGDSFFNSIDSWLDESGTAPQTTPHEAIKQGLVEAVVNNPVFVALNDNPRFLRIKKRMQDIV